MSQEYTNCPDEYRKRSPIKDVDHQCDDSALSLNFDEAYKVTDNCFEKGGQATIMKARCRTSGT